MVEKSIYRRAKLYLGFDRSSRRRVRPASTSRIRPGQQAYLDARALDHLNEKYPRMPKKDKQKVILQGFTVVGAPLAVQLSCILSFSREMTQSELPRISILPIGLTWQ